MVIHSKAIEKGDRVKIIKVDDFSRFDPVLIGCTGTVTLVCSRVVDGEWSERMCIQTDDGNTVYVGTSAIELESGQ